MDRIIDALVLGIYAPIVVFSGIACYLFLSRLLIPAMKEGSFSVDQYAIGVSACAALAAHFGESLYYGVPRWVGEWDRFNDFLVGVGLLKLLILVSSVFAVAALSQAATSATHLGRLTVIAAALWAGASAAALVLV